MWFSKNRKSPNIKNARQHITGDFTRNNDIQQVHM